MNDFFEWLTSTSLGTAVRESTSIFPWVESIHVLALTVVVGSIAIVDLRLLNVASRARPVSRLLKEMLPMTWIAFSIAAASGTVMFISQASHYAQNGPLQIKALLLLLAGINMLMFHNTTLRTVSTWDNSTSTPLGARLAAAGSLMLWTSIVLFGRWIGFV